MKQIITIRQYRDGNMIFLAVLSLSMLTFYAVRSVMNGRPWHVTAFVIVLILIAVFVIFKKRVFSRKTSEAVRVLTLDRKPVSFELSDALPGEPDVSLSDVTGIQLYSESGRRVLIFEAGRNTFTLPAFKKPKSAQFTYPEQDFFAEFVDACNVPNTLSVKRAYDGFVSLGKKEAKQYLRINALEVIRPKD